MRTNISCQLLKINYLYFEIEAFKSAPICFKPAMDSDPGDVAFLVILLGSWTIVVLFQELCIPSGLLWASEELLLLDFNLKLLAFVEERWKPTNLLLDKGEPNFFLILDLVSFEIGDEIASSSCCVFDEGDKSALRGRGDRLVGRLRLLLLRSSVVVLRRIVRGRLGLATGNLGVSSSMEP